MKISIDTKEESTESLRHTLKMLEALIAAREGAGSYADSSGGIMGMFDNSSSSSSSASTESSSGGIFSLFSDKDSGRTETKPEPTETTTDEEIPEVRIIDY